jgi:hypothetical protein
MTDEIPTPSEPKPAVPSVVIEAAERAHPAARPQTLLPYADALDRNTAEPAWREGRPSAETHAETIEQQRKR